MSTFRKIVVGGVAAAMLVTTAGVGVAKTFRVKATSSDSWKKVHTYIGKGDTVRWSNPDSEAHDLTAYGGGWKMSQQLEPGATAKKRFKKKGTFRYRCVIHSGIVGGACKGMCGFVHVL
jgi:plastocyanin